MHPEGQVLGHARVPRVRGLVGRFLVSPLGQARLEGLVPFDSAERMATALAQAREMAAWLVGGARLPLGPLSDLGPRLEALRGSGRPFEPADFADLLRLLRSSVRLRRLLSGLAEAPALVRLGERLPDLEPLLARVEGTVDERGEVLSSASPRLAELRAEVQRQHQRIDDLLQRLVEDPLLRRNLQSPQVAWRNGRPVLQVKPEAQRFVPGIFHDRSQSGQTVFVVPQQMVEPVNRLAEARAEEAAEVRRLLAELLREVVARDADVELAQRGVAWIDYTHARARLVHELGFVVPRPAEPGRFRLRGARHPLLLTGLFEGTKGRDEALAEVVPLDLDLGDPYSMVVVTGPNTGGKTVALKTVGLCVLMAQAGMPLPCDEGTALPWVDGIWADIGDEQAIEQNLSTFSSHLVRIGEALASAGGDSLVLLDELGAGTDPEEGGALGYAILERLVAARVPTLASTHLGRLKDFAYQHEGVENGAMAFDPERLAPLFRLDIGIPGSSNALTIARRVGIDDALVDRAREILGERDHSLEDVIGKVQVARQAAEQQRRAAERTRARIDTEERELADRQARFEQRESWLREEAEHFVEEELKAARSLLTEPLAQFVNAPEPYREKARGLVKLLEELLAGTSLGRRRERYLAQVKKGHMVYVPRYRRRCKVLKLERARRRVHVEMGGLKVEVPFEEISWLQPLDD
ncbi:MAG: hypothetical protein R3F30_13365 [Planctomycetota bacterium]